MVQKIVQKMVQKIVQKMVQEMVQSIFYPMPRYTRGFEAIGDLISV